MHEMRRAHSDTGVGGAQTGGLAWSYFPGWMVPGDLCQQLPTYLQKVAARPTSLRQKNADCPRDQVIVARSGQRACLGMAETNDSAGASLGNTQK